MNMEPGTINYHNNLSPEDQKALNVGKYLIRVMNEIFKGEHAGEQILLPLKHNGGIVKCSLSTTPTKVETILEYNDDEVATTKWLHYTWNAQDQVWILNK